ncbi:hypothetical protein GCM10007103_33320 [Salinimicrobium marinum]|uniref:SpoIIAA-like n=1 Tax=Salinimicrobium marinum TaxID=680283 RepID=A0A918SMH7_9FLAO|nr:hypothetical protein [Salinimicrobium marinum]GHA49856.1 hypothetical protein GCM10007103_33320 [Salinimicrobium marinum]
MSKKYELDFGIVRIFDNILISELNEGILFDVASNRQLLDIGTQEFHGKPYGYISNRIFSYAVDPLVYRESANHTSLKAIAVVTNNEIGLKAAQLEQNFYKKDRFKVFTSYKEALAWMNGTLADF